MPFASRYSSAEAQLLITLSGFAYIDSDPLPGETLAEQAVRMRTDIDAALAASDYPTWHVVWGPGLSGNGANMLYVAGELDTNRLAVAIRGTDWSFWLNWLEDLGSVLPLVPFTYVLPSMAAGDPQIAAGTNVGLELLIRTRAEALDGEVVDLATFLAQAGSSAEVFVTGHSLGGCLASVLAPALAQQLGTARNLKVYTFAAPSAGDEDFATYYDRLFTDDAGNSRSFRVHNDLDIVPLSWASLPAIGQLYVPAPICSDRVRDVIARAQAVVGTVYQQLGTAEQGSAITLHGELSVSISVALTPDRGSLMYFREVGQQHATETYMQLLGAKAIPVALAKLTAVHAKLVTEQLTA